METTVAANIPGDQSGESNTTYEFRWDVEVPDSERKYGQKFMKQWKRVLQVQKLSPLVSSNLCPRSARFQLCIGVEVETEQIRQREAEILEELSHLRWSTAANTPEQALRDEPPIEGEPAGKHPAGWQGVRVWMTFERSDVETALAKKPKL